MQERSLSLGQVTVCGVREIIFGDGLFVSRRSRGKNRAQLTDAQWTKRALRSSPIASELGHSKGSGSDLCPTLVTNDLQKKGGVQHGRALDFVMKGVSSSFETINNELCALLQRA